MNRYQKYFSKFLTQNKDKTHFACHSHHYWPDCTFEAQIKYWNDSAQYVDDKWENIFSTTLPETFELICEVLNFSRPKDISFAPNTHELVYRVLSSFNKKIKILTTDSEFYSFSRQLNRLIELDKVEATVVTTDSLDDLEDRIIKASDGSHDVIFLSQVFFNSGVALKNLEGLVKKIKNENNTIIIDGYHAFMAIPTSLKNIENDIFYVAGSYKYAAGGEGFCFMTMPKDTKLKPANTGWFAELADLSNVKEGEVPFSNSGMRFAGSTMDMSALYRLNSVLNLYKKEKINTEVIHAHVQKCQSHFLELIDKLNHPKLNRKNLIVRDINNHGHFLTFKLSSSEEVEELSNDLKARGIITDSRKDRLRFGFSIYHDPKDYKL
jgi:selenocysteine lyase/cysteine desulfurase